MTSEIRDKVDIVATYELDSDVPALYFSFSEYKLFRKVAPKVCDAHPLTARLVCNGICLIVALDGQIHGCRHDKQLWGLQWPPSAA